MTLNIVSFILFYFLIINCTIGYGYLTVHLYKLEHKYFNHGYLGLLGIFTLLFISYITHFFVPHNYIHNIFLLVIGFISFIYFNKKKKDLIKINILFLILFISFLLIKAHDDFPYYHFPYTYYLTQNNLLVGIGNFNHGFRTPSSIFFLNSIFYLPIIKYYFFHIGAILIMGYSSFIFLKIIEKKFFNKENDLFYFLSLFSFAFIYIFFYRIGEHGTDRSAQILVFLLIIELLLLINFHTDIKSSLIKITVILGTIISLKAFYILYSIFLIPLIYFLIKDKKYFYLVDLFQSIVFYKLLIIIFCILLINFLSTGCFIYPLSITCAENFSWSIPISEVSLMNNWYELWSKAGANPNFRVENPELYIQNFNWLGNWFKEYFFTKVSDFVFGIFFMILVFFLLFYSNTKQIKTYKGIFFIYLIVLILFIEWFYNHPALRYGGYPLLCLMIFIPTSFILSKSIIDRKIQKNTVIIITLVLFIFLGRNVSRLIKENAQYNYNFIKKTSYNVVKEHFRITDQYNKILQDKNNCLITNQQCKRNKGEINVKEKFGYKIYYKNR
tara:strand:- start:3578 stop:5245 length:1668 start_codon:yes stop_codon:yes gene_type:complete